MAKSEILPCPKCNRVHCALWRRLKDRKFKKGELSKLLATFHADPCPSCGRYPGQNPNIGCQDKSFHEAAH